MTSHWPEGIISSIVVVWDDYERGVGGIAWRVGEDGVTLPYVRVWKGNHAVAEYCQHALREVRFVKPQP
jgi:hypothetical protein